MSFTTRPVIMGTHGVISTGHYLASAAGLRVLHNGGNAVDAGVTAAFCLAVLEPHQYSIGGEAIMLFYSAEQEKVISISGHGIAPKNMTIDWFKEHEIDPIPGNGMLPATVPSAVDGLITTLKKFGTKTLADTLAPAVELAEKGFPMYDELRKKLVKNYEKFAQEWPSSIDAFFSQAELPNVGELFIQLLWANTFKLLLEAEKANSGKGREAALEAARDIFYKGEIAEKIVDFAQNFKCKDSSGKVNSGFLTKEDLADFHIKIEEPLTFNYRGYDVYKCGPWCQGPVFLQQLALLEGFDLKAMGHNSADYIHTVAEAAKLAFADREAYYGDWDFDEVPLNILLSKDYAAKRRKLIDPKTASADFKAGDVGRGELPYEICSAVHEKPEEQSGDTTHLDVIDADGNMFSATTSGGWLMDSPAVKGLGFPLGTRCQMFYLDSRRPNALEPGKRPRTTLTPSLTLKDGKPFMAFGTPGGDMQDQWTLQFFINVIDFGMNLQEAADAASFHIEHFPCSFDPRQMLIKRLNVERRVGTEVIEELKARGHDVVVDDDWTHGKVLGITIENKIIKGCASPKNEIGYAIGW